MTFTPLAFEVAHCSSSEDDHPPENLVQSSPGNQLIECTNLQDTDLSNVKGKGWQTPKCPTYPQDLIIHLLCGPARISKIQLLSHHYKIATKVDIYIGLLKEGTEDLSIESEEDEDDTLIEFTRLGYICFDNNARAQFRARELKSIKINADGEYIRLVVRNCHQNRLNTYNQVGILALNILGYPLMHHDPSMQQIPRHLQSSLDESSMLSSSTRRTSVSSSHSITHGLSASGVVELELQHWISALLHAEELAVRDESYQKAKVYKGLSDQLNKFSKILSDFEQAKRLAVDTKDYDEAEKIKGDINEIKQTAEMIIKQSNITITDDGLVLPLNEDEYQQMLDNSTVNMQDENGSGSLQDQMYDEAIAKWTNFDTNKSETNNDNSDNENINNITEIVETSEGVVVGNNLPEMMNEVSLSSKTTTSLASTDLAEMLMPPYLTSYHSEKGNPDHHNQPFPIISSSMSAKIERRKSLALEKSSQISSTTNTTTTNLSSVHEDIIEEEEEEEFEEEIIDPEAIPEDIMDEERGTYHDAIQLFGEEMVACVLSIKSKCRERGLTHIQHCVESAYQLASKQSLNQLSSLFVSPVSHDHDLPSFIVNAALMMVQEAVMDSREAIVSLAIVIWQQLNDFYQSANIDALLISEWMNRTFSALLKRTGDSNKNIRNNASDLVIVLVYTHTTTTGTTSLLNQYVGKPDRLIHQYKEATARVQLVKRTFEELKLEEQGGIIPLNHLMAFITTYLQHNHEEVKNESMNLLISVASVVELKQLSNYLDDTIRSALQQKLRTTTNTHLVPNKDSAVAELRALTVQSGVEKKQTVKKSQLTTNGTTDKRRPASNTTTDKKKITTTKRTTTTTTTKRNQKTNANGTTTTNSKKSEQPSNNNNATQEPAVDPKENSMCIFCDEQNDQFNEQTLITHYYKDCPALTNCPMCQIIVEVSTLHSHILKDCEKRHLMKQCTRCKQAIPVEQWLQHTLKNTCTAYTNPDEVRCPLCLISIEPPTEEGWRLHLLNGEGCPKNQRRQRHRDTTSQKKSTTTTTASSLSSNNTTTAKKSSANNSNGLDKKPSSTRIKQSSIKKK